jgi:hypothetical protein
LLIDPRNADEIILEKWLGSLVVAKFGRLRMDVKLGRPSTQNDASYCERASFSSPVGNR